MQEIKRCGSCEKEFPATVEYYHKDKQGLYGLHSKCKKCRNDDRKRRYEEDVESGIPRKYYLDNRDRHLVQAMKKRGYKHLTVEQLQSITNNFKGKSGNNICPYCDREIEDTDMMHYDHLVPYSEGGADIITNLVPVCKYCNRSKMNENFSDWYRNQFFYNEQKEREILRYFLGRKLKPFYSKDKVGRVVANKTNIDELNIEQISIL